MTVKKAKLSKIMILIAIIGLMFSGALRLSDVINLAQASSFDLENLKIIPQESQVKSECNSDEDLEKALSFVREQRELLQIFENDLNERRAELDLREKNVQNRYNLAQNKEAKVRKLLRMAQTASEEDVQSLAEIYTSMKPKQAAKLFERMDVHLAAGFLGLMQTKDAAAIMEQISPEVANSLASTMASRRVTVNATLN